MSEQTTNSEQLYGRPNINSEIGKIASNGAEEQVKEPEYEILAEGFMPGETGEDLRQRYIYLTQRTIKRICGYGDSEDAADRVIFLDKSARPVAWMVREFWDEFADIDEKTGEKMPMPAMSFLNIDRDDWIDKGDVEQVNGVTYWNGKHSMGVGAKRSLRSTFIDVETLPEDISEANEKEPTIIDGQKVLVVDETKTTGLTRQVALAQLKEAFPDTEFEGWHWMNPPVKINAKNQSFAQYDNPVWYKPDSPKGRAVGNRSFEVSENSSSKRQRLGKEYLSTRPDEVDEEALQLREEIKLLHRDYQDGTLEVPEDYGDRLAKNYARFS